VPVQTLHENRATELRHKQKTEPELYNGYEVWGMLSRRMEATPLAAITSGRKFIEGSGVLATCGPEGEARAIGMAWARAWVDTHG